MDIVVSLYEAPPPVVAFAGTYARADWTHKQRPVFVQRGSSPQRFLYCAFDGRWLLSACEPALGLGAARSPPELGLPWEVAGLPWEIARPQDGSWAKSPGLTVRRAHRRGGGPSAEEKGNEEVDTGDAVSVPVGGSARLFRSSGAWYLGFPALVSFDDGGDALWLFRSGRDLRWVVSLEAPHGHEPPCLQRSVEAGALWPPNATTGGAHREGDWFEEGPETPASFPAELRLKLRKVKVDEKGNGRPRCLDYGGLSYCAVPHGYLVHGCPLYVSVGLVEFPLETAPTDQHARGVGKMRGAARFLYRHGFFL